VGVLENERGAVAERRTGRSTEETGVVGQDVHPNGRAERDRGQDLALTGVRVRKNSRTDQPGEKRVPVFSAVLNGGVVAGRAVQQAKGGRAAKVARPLAEWGRATGLGRTVGDAPVAGRKVDRAGRERPAAVYWRGPPVGKLVDVGCCACGATR